MTLTGNASNSGSNTPARQNLQSSSRSNMKAAAAGIKGPDGIRKQTASPADGATRPPAQKAWGSGTNPITQRPTGTAQANGASPAPRPMSQSVAKESNTADQHAHDRLLFICGASIGLAVTMTTKNGDVYKGIMSSSMLNTNDQSITLKMVQQQTQSDLASNGAVAASSQPYVGSAPDYAVAFDIRDLADLSIPSLSLSDVKTAQNGTPQSFRTDTDISGNKEAVERKLQKWVPDEEIGTEMSLESSGTGGWDQFETNERKFGTKSTYDENLYTIAIDRSHASYREREAAAAKLAREIEGSTSTNAHIREERGQGVEDEGDDEETKYSGVRRGDIEFPPLTSGQANKYTPPARRAPTGQPTVAGAPVDPAIISAQLSRPDGPSRQTKAAVKPNEASIPEIPVINKLSDTVDSAEAPPSGSTAESASAAASTKNRTSNISLSPSGKLPVAENATEGVENALLSQFRDFARVERQKVQERRRVQASHDRTTKLNDLIRFSKSFKLHTPVPKDLVPILAQDPAKQEEIMKKAQQESEDKKKKAATTTAVAAAPASAQATAATSLTASPVATPETKSSSRAQTSGRFEQASTPQSAPTDRQTLPRGRQGYPPTGPMATQGGRMPQQALPMRGGPSGSYINHRAGKGAMANPVPTPIPLDHRVSSNQPHPASGMPSPSRSGIATPPSAMSTKFNVAAHEFRPSSFAPAPSSVAASSPQSTAARTRSASRARSPVIFFTARKPVPEVSRPKFSSFFNPIQRMKKESEGQPAGKNYAANGGIPEPYRTQVRWDVPEANVEKTYRDMFDKTSAPAAPMSPSARTVQPGYVPHHHQLPQHMQNGGPSMAHTPHAPPAMQAQHSQQGHYDDHHRMPLPAGGHVYQSPRVGQAQVMYQSPMPGQAQLYGQAGPQYFPQGQVPIPMRGYPGTPQFVQPQAVPMMAQQSQGSYMTPQFNHQMPMYSPSPGQAYPAHVASQPQSGYPSPSRGAPMMVHQGSQQGHHPQGMMYMSAGQPGQPMYNPQQGHMANMRPGYPHPSTGQYASSPHQPHHYPQQPHRAPSNAYGLGSMPQKTPQHMTPQQGTPAMPTSYSESHLADDGGK